MVGAFLEFLEQQANRAETLYILGDLFDQWLGDDDDLDPHPAVVAALTRLTASGVTVALLHGNHDFLLGERFAARTGCQLLRDPTVIEVHGTPVLIMHGDTLCTDDLAYQALRAQVRDPANQARFLALPLPRRAAEADSLRSASQQQTRLKPQDIMMPVLARSSARCVSMAYFTLSTATLTARRYIHFASMANAQHESSLVTGTANHTLSSGIMPVIELWRHRYGIPLPSLPSRNCPVLLGDTAHPNGGRMRKSGQKDIIGNTTT